MISSKTAIEAKFEFKFFPVSGIAYPIARLLTSKKLAVSPRQGYPRRNEFPRMSMPDVPHRRILVVDDEPFVCEAVELMLRFDGHEVATAGSGKAALEMLGAGKFDLVITDYEMPGMKGDELATAIKGRFPKLPVVMITAYAELLQSSGKPATGVDAVISKPFLLENLREAIAKVTALQRASQGRTTDSRS